MGGALARKALSGLGELNDGRKALGGWRSYWSEPQVTRSTGNPSDPFH